MKFPKTKISLPNFLIAVLICTTGVLGYLYYDLHSTNIKDKELIKSLQEENLDFSQDNEIYKDNIYKLNKENKTLKSRNAKVVYKYRYIKSNHKTSAGKSSKYSKKRVSYKKLYYQLKNHCNKRNKSKKSYKSSNNYKRQTYYKKR